MRLKRLMDRSGADAASASPTAELLFLLRLAATDSASRRVLNLPTRTRNTDGVRGGVITYAYNSAEPLGDRIRSLRRSARNLHPRIPVPRLSRRRSGRWYSAAGGGGRSRRRRRGLFRRRGAAVTAGAAWAVRRPPVRQQTGAAAGAEARSADAAARDEGFSSPGRIRFSRGLK